MKLQQVLFLPGDGFGYKLLIQYLTPDKPIGKGGTCAFCKGDPLGEESSQYSAIALYMGNAGADVCPFCLGRQT